MVMLTERDARLSISGIGLAVWILRDSEGSFDLRGETLAAAVHKSDTRLT